MAGFEKGHKKLGGRRPGSRNKTKSLAAQVRKAAAEMKVTPLEYMLGIVSDPDADPERRGPMTAAAAPYVHARLQATVARIESEVTVVNEEERRRQAQIAILEAFWEQPRDPSSVEDFAQAEKDKSRRMSAHGLIL